MEPPESKEEKVATMINLLWETNYLHKIADHNQRNECRRTAQGQRQCKQEDEDRQEDVLSKVKRAGC